MPSNQRNESLIGDFSDSYLGEGCFGDRVALQTSAYQQLLPRLGFVLFSTKGHLFVELRLVCMIQVSVFTVGRSPETYLIVSDCVFQILLKKTSTNRTSRREQFSSADPSFQLDDNSGCTYGHALL